MCGDSKQAVNEQSPAHTPCQLIMNTYNDIPVKKMNNRDDNIINIDQHYW